MAIGTPSESPAIVVTEIDRSGVVPNVQTTTGAFDEAIRHSITKDTKPLVEGLIKRYFDEDKFIFNLFSLKQSPVRRRGFSRFEALSARYSTFPIKWDPILLQNSKEI